MQLSATLTIQAPGVAVFDQPVKLTFPNIYNAAPGTKLPFYSFDHTTGQLVITGTATVSADGKFAVTDPENGITHPGWYGVTPPGAVARFTEYIADLKPTKDPNTSGCNALGIAQDASLLLLGLSPLLPASATFLATAATLVGAGAAAITALENSENQTAPDYASAISSAFNLGGLFAPKPGGGNPDLSLIFLRSAGPSRSWGGISPICSISSPRYVDLDRSLFGTNSHREGPLHENCTAQAQQAISGEEVEAHFQARVVGREHMHRGSVVR